MLNFAASPLTDNKGPIGELTRSLLNPTKREIEEWRRKNAEATARIRAVLEKQKSA